MANELKKTILEFSDIQEEMVTVPEWGDTKVLVRGMTSGQRAHLLDRANENGKVNMVNWFSDLVIATAVDPDTGEFIFEKADRDALKGKNGAAVNRLSTVAARLSGLNDEAVEDAKANFDGTPKTDSDSS